MKRGTINHPKTMRLAKLLGIQRYSAVGLLESLWHLTGTHSPRGNVGRWDDELIAEWLGWERDPGELIAALAQAGWLEDHPTARLVVHDWHEHADQAVKRRLLRREESFIVGGIPRIDGSPVRSGRPSEPGGSKLTCPDMSGLPEPDPVPEPDPDPDPESRRRGSPQSGGVCVEEECLVVAIYQSYPKHQAKQKAMDAIAKSVTRLAVRFDGDRQRALLWLLERTRRYASSEYVRDSDKKYIPHPASWFNQGRFDDEDPEPSSRKERGAGRTEDWNARRRSREWKETRD